MCSSIVESERRADCEKYDITGDGRLSAADLWPIVFDCQATPTITPTPTNTPTFTPTVSQTYDPNCNLYAVRGMAVMVDPWGNNYGPEKTATGAGASLNCIREKVKDCELVRANNFKMIIDAYCDDEIYWWFRMHVQNNAEAYVTTFMNKNRQATDPPKDFSKEVCGTLDIRFASSPISLVWDKAGAENQLHSIVTFPVNNQPGLSWQVWKGSKAMPLLVYDPAHKGNITSASQLFGNWTFGGKQVAALDSSVGQQLPKPWSNGFEALSQLDRDGDARITGDELNEIGLWFDNNQDGVSQAGEVQPVKDTGVTALFVTPTWTDTASGDVFATLGYERVGESGNVVRGSSVDWYSESFSTRTEATLKLQNRGALYRTAHPTRDRGVVPRKEPESVTARTIDPLLIKEGAWVGGVWEWRAKEGAFDAGHRPELLPKGIITFSEYMPESGPSDERKIMGHSWLENELIVPRGDAALLVSAIPVKGLVTSVNGLFDVEFDIATQDGGIIKSRGKVLDGGLAMEGVTDVHVPSKPGRGDGLKFSYEWVAERK